MKPTIYNVATPFGVLRHRMLASEWAKPEGEGVRRTLCGNINEGGWVKDAIGPGDPVLKQTRDCPACIAFEYERYGQTCYFILEEGGETQIPVAIFKVTHLLSGPAAAEQYIRWSGQDYKQHLEQPEQGLFDWYELMKAVSEHKLKVPSVRVEKVALVHDKISTLWSDQLIL